LWSRPLAARLNTTPGPETADANRPFQGIPSIERAANGRLWAAWYGGGTGEDRYNYVMAATSVDDGDTWSGLKLVIDPDGPGPERAFDPLPWLDPAGRLWLFWAQMRCDRTIAENPSCTWATVTDEPGHESPAWSEPRRIADGIVMNKPVVRADGTWLLPAARWHQDGSAGVAASSDNGETLERIGAASVPDPADRDCDEHMIVERRDGSLWMLVRTKYGIGESTSGDGGRTWTPVEPSAIAHTTSRFHVRRLRSGALLLVKHGRIDERGGRRDLTAFVSDDDGRTWTGGLMIDERDQVSYPDAVESPEGTIFLIYDHDRTGDKAILLARFTESDVRSGRFASPRSATRLLVNQADGANPVA
jgi:hypothetical protein